MSEDTASKPYFERLLLWPNFELTADAIDGRIPSCRVKDWEAFQSNLNGEVEDPTGGEIIYRGQRRFDWQLESTLTRRFDGGAIPPDMAERMLKKFKLAMRGRGIDLSETLENEVWAYGQHYGLATPLVDWTDSPFVALFFAFAKEDVEAEKPNPSRAVFRLNRAKVEELLPELFFEPALGENARLVNQAGLFTVTPAGDDNLATAIINAIIETGAIDPDDADQLANYICKIHIPNVERDACLAMLRKMNIHHANLFPDPSGASDYCNDWLERCVKDQKAKARKDKEAEQRTRRRVTLSELAATNVDNFEAVANLLREGLSDDDTTNMSELAMKIDAKYSEAAALDWPQRPSGVAQLKVAFRHLLSLFGYRESSIPATVERLIAFYKMKYEAAR
jgi:hypothetical protein